MMRAAASTLVPKRSSSGEDGLAGVKTDAHLHGLRGWAVVGVKRALDATAHSTAFRAESNAIMKLSPMVLIS